MHSSCLSKTLVSKIPLSLLLIGALVFGGALPAKADGGFGSIAIEVGTWAWGTWHDGNDAASASSGALAECNKNTNGANDCVVVVTFSQHACAAVAHDQNNNYKFNYGNTSTEAIGAAVSLLSSGTAITSVCNSTASAPAAFVPEPIRVSESVVGNDTSPVYVYKSTLESESDHTYQQCLSWRNLANKAVVAIKFDAHIYDDFNAPLQSFTATTKEGEHDTPGIGIDNICWNGTLWTAAQIKQMRVEKITVLSVRFDDDSVWTPGTGWTKTYSSSGTQLPSPETIAANVPQPAPSGGQNTNVVPAPGPTSPGTVNIGGAVGYATNLGPTGTAFGAIAAENSTHVVGISTDASSDDAAVIDAATKCNAKTNGANDCTILVKFSGAAKCAAVAVDGSLAGIATGPDSNSTVAAALAALRAKGGNIGNNIIASPCNSR